MADRRNHRPGFKKEREKEEAAEKLAWEACFALPLC